ncbi:MAG: phasin family protein [Gammaproteobacteria bacterium]|nr:phasin family protein [Gammaproteobacteria bacterium]
MAEEKKTIVEAKVPEQKEVKKVAKKATKKVAKKAAKKAKTVKKVATKKATAAKKVVKAEAVNVESRIAQLQDIFKENLEGLNETGDKAEALAKNIWLAGLGAYSRAYEEVSDRYDDIQGKVEEINEEGQKIFGDLVKRGQNIQNDIEDEVGKRKDSLEERVEEFRTRFGGGLSSFVDIPDRLREAAEKVEEIGKKLRGKK